MEENEIIDAELSGLQRMVLEDVDLRELRERRTLLRQSIADEHQHLHALEQRKKWIQEFATINTNLQIHQQEAQNASRHWASLGSERNSLAIYDRIFSLRPLYDRIKVKEEILTRVREIYNEYEQELQEAQVLYDSAKATADVARQRRTDADEAIRHRIADINAGYHIVGVRSSLEKQVKACEILLRQLQLNLNVKEKNLHEIRHQEAEAIKEKEEANTLLKGLSAHSVMLGLYDLVKDKLSAMSKERALNTKLHQQQTEAQRNRQMLQQSLRQRENEYNLLQSEYDGYNSQLRLLNQSSDTALDIVRAPIIRDAEETQRQLDKFLSIRSQIRNLEEQCHMAEMQIEAKRVQLEELHIESAVADSHRLALEQSMRESDVELSSLYADLDKTITLSGWFTEWQHNPDSLRARISELYHDWQNARTRFNEASRTMNLLHESLKGAEQSVAEARQQEIAQRNMRDALRRELEDQNEKLRATLGEKSPSELEAHLNLELSLAHEKFVESNEILLEQQHRLSESRSRLNTILHLQKLLQEVISQENAEYDLWLENNNHSGASLLQRSLVNEIFSSSRDWNAIRQSLNDADLRQATAAIQLKNTQQQLATVQRESATDQPGSDDTAAQIRQQCHDSELRMERYEDELREVEGKLYSHDLAMRKIDIIRRQR